MKYEGGMHGSSYNRLSAESNASLLSDMSALSGGGGHNQHEGEALTTCAVATACLYLPLIYSHDIRHILTPHTNPVLPFSNPVLP